VILVDTSVWIDLLAGSRVVPQEDVVHFVTCGPILQEILQGLRDAPATAALRDALLSLSRVSDSVALTTFLHAADIYCLGRRRGYTIRSSTDCLIAAIAIENSLPVWHRDRDFPLIARYTNLDVVGRR
jgi:hypothetical protein